MFACALMLSSCVLFGLDNGVHIHSYDEWVITVRPTCTEQGERERYCSCGEKQTGKLAPLGHDLAVYERLDPTCTEDGYEGYSVCTRCGEGDEKIILPATGHKRVPHEKLEPTCSDSGYEAYSECSVCGLSDYTEIPALGHSFCEWIETAPATCTAKGTQVRVCSRDCTHTEERQTDELGHDESEWITVAEPSCSAEGRRNKTCSVCKTITAEEAIPKLAHKFQECVIKTPTCEEEGEKCLKCTECAFEKDNELIPASGHNFGEWEITAEPLCNRAGEKIRVCLRDENHIERIEIPKLGHTESEVVEVPPVCEAEGLRYTECIVCHAVLSSEIIPRLGHDFGEWEETPATCTSAGLFTRVCSHDKSHIQTVETEKLPHTPGEWIVVKEPDYGEAGERYKECTVCHTELERESIPALEPTDESGLLFTLSDDGESYAVSGYSRLGDEVIIPSEYLGKPVTEILSGAFSNAVINSITIPETVVFIHANAFKDCAVSAVNLQKTDGWFFTYSDGNSFKIGDAITTSPTTAADYLKSQSYICDWKRDKNI